MQLLICISLIFGTFCIVNELLRIKKQESFFIVNLFGILYGVIYGFLPAAYLIDNHPEIYDIDFSGFGLSNLLIWILLSIVGYILFQLFYIGKKTQINITNNYSKHSLKPLQLTLVVCILIGLVSMFLWSMAFGGIQNLILVANSVRSGRADITNAFAFFKHPARIVLFCSYLSLFLLKLRYRILLNSLLFIISFIASILFLLANDGRMPFAFFILTLLLMLIDFLKKGAISLRKLLFLSFYSVVMMTFILYLDSITIWIRTGFWVSPFLYSNTPENSLLTEFAFIIRAGQASVNEYLTMGSPFLFFDDLGSALFAWLPSSLKPYEFINLWDYNTEKVLVLNDLGGQQPCDFISASLYYLGFWGIVVNTYIWAKIIRFIDKKHKLTNNSFGFVVYYTLLYTFIRLPLYCSFYYILLSQFNLFLAWIVWNCSIKIFKTRKCNLV